jgi:DNA invertase Pin-like site-specific DNA recombinase
MLAPALAEAGMTKRAAIYVRVSTDQQTIENQLRELHRIGERRGSKSSLARLKTA